MAEDLAEQLDRVRDVLDDVYDQLDADDPAAHHLAQARAHTETAHLLVDTAALVSDHDSETGESSASADGTTPQAFVADLASDLDDSVDGDDT